jgi:chromosome segregation ATPase
MTNDELEADIKKLNQRLTEEINSRTRDLGVFKREIASLQAENIKLLGTCHELAVRVTNLEKRLAVLEENLEDEDVS